MLSRSNSKASASLRQDKVLTSRQLRRMIPTNSFIRNPEIARQHAITAASRAYKDAHEVNTRVRGTDDNSFSQAGANGNQRLSTKRSIRFTGPTAEPNNQPDITRRSVPGYQDGFDSHPRSLRPRSSVQEGFMSNFPQHAEYEEIQTASQPSSYRRLRKSQSMVNPRRLTALSRSGSASREGSFLRARYDQHPQPLGSRLRRSMSIFRFHSQRSPHRGPSERVSESGAIEIARAQYFRQLQRPKSQETAQSRQLCNHPKKHRQFPKTVRTSSIDTSSTVTKPPSAHLAGGTTAKSLGRKARSVSSSLKSKLKQILGRRLDTEGILPAQQLDATRPYYGDYSEQLSEMGTERHFSVVKNIPTMDNSLDSSSFDVPRRDSSPANSVHSTDTDSIFNGEKSRVTSWSNSSATNTLALQHLPNRKSLSVIQENIGFVSPAPSQPFRDLDYRHDASEASNLPKGIHRSPKSNDLIASGSTGCLLAGRVPLSKSESQRMELRKENHLPPQATSRQAEITKHQGKRPLREVKSVFFPPSITIERNRLSPYRRAMQFSEDSLGTKADILPNFRPLSVPSRDDNMTPDRVQNSSPSRSESLYSRTPSGITPQLKSRSFSPAEPASTGLDGPAVQSIESNYQNCLLTPVTQSKAEPILDSGPGSAPIMSLPEREPRVGLFSSVSKAAKEVQNPRRKAQVNGESADLGSPRPFRMKRRLPHIGSGPQSSATLPVKKSSPQPMIERFPLMDIKVHQNTVNARQHSPLAQAKSSQEAPSTENAGFKCTGSLRRLENLVPEQSSTTLALKRPAEKSKEESGAAERQSAKQPENHFSGDKIYSTSSTDAKGRFSPERLIRLRRMQNSKANGSPSPRKKMNTQLQNYHPRVPYETGIPKEQSVSFQEERSGLRILADAESYGEAANEDSITEGRRLFEFFTNSLKTTPRDNKSQSSDDAFI
ncbi:MAG: hypothetical protein LQ342_000147 [Letrouitia transgressa]|nr:MAG: hypothetical protein LQ342_000147 [Letrouitia transgressa]